MSFLLKLFPSLKKREGDFFNELEQILGTKPRDSSLYRLAFRHSSASKKETENATPLNNERLEFLGDAILGAIVADYLYSHYPDQNEGFLTRMRSKIVSRKNLNNIAEELKIIPLVLSKLDKRKPAKSIGGDTLEALIGAIYLDRGIKHAKHFIYTKILNESSILDDLESQIISYKGLIIEWAQKERKPFEFTLLNQWGKQHNMTFKMGLQVDDKLISTGTGSSKKRAEEAAAQKAFDVLKLDK